MTRDRLARVRTEKGERIAFSPDEVSGLTGLSLNNVYALIREGKIPHVRFGRRILVPKNEFKELFSPISYEPQHKGDAKYHRGIASKEGGN
jgi:excisionase family DNA binding protein|tara:strand:- start:2166 stop:2438 length:273 start_codon:yes stop_codon:yes gene_type:complete